MTNTICGTIPYMAPEVISRQPYKKSSDVYSYGITLWEMITRTRPYEHMDNAPQIMHGVCNSNLRPIIDATMPHHMKSLIAKYLKHLFYNLTLYSSSSHRIEFVTDVGIMIIWNGHRFTILYRKCHVGDRKLQHRRPRHCLHRYLTQNEYSLHMTH